MSRRAVLGLDIGGSKSQAVLVEGDRVAADVLAGTANIASSGVAAATTALDDLVVQLGHRPVHAVCAGAAGADSADGRARLADLLRQRFPDARVEVVHDTRIILAAADLVSGTVVISGTGSAVWGRTSDGREARAGGWGYLLGDEGSAYGVTRAAVRAALREADLGRPAGPLTSRLLAATGLQDTWQLLDRFYDRPERRYWADLATHVFALAATGDPLSVEIADGAAEGLADLATTVNDRLGLRGPVVLAGGLAVNQPMLTARVTELLEQRGQADVRVLSRAPAYGAVQLARVLLGEHGEHDGHRS